MLVEWLIDGQNVWRINKILNPGFREGIVSKWQYLLLLWICSMSMPLILSCAINSTSGQD